MNIIGFIDGISKLYENAPLTEKELSEIDDYARNLLSQMKDDSIEYESQNALDEYVDFYERKNTRKKANAIVSEYYDTINRKQSLQNSISPLEEERKLVMKPIKDNSGIITIIALLDIISLVGITIGIILLALR